MKENETKFQTSGCSNKIFGPNEKLLINKFLIHRFFLHCKRVFYSQPWECVIQLNGDIYGPHQCAPPPTTLCEIISLRIVSVASRDARFCCLSLMSRKINSTEMYCNKFCGGICLFVYFCFVLFIVYFTQQKEILLKYCLNLFKFFEFVEIYSNLLMNQIFSVSDKSN